MSQVTKRFHGGSCYPTLVFQGKVPEGTPCPAMQTAFLLEPGFPCFGKPAAASLSLALQPESCLLPLQQFKTGQESVRLPYVEKGKEGKCPSPEEEAKAFGSRIRCQNHQCCRRPELPVTWQVVCIFSSYKSHSAIP